VTYVLDTHVWVWWHVAPLRLSPASASALGASSGNDLVLPAISIWEVAKLVEKGRLAFNEPLDLWVHEALRMPCLRLAPLSPAVAIESTRLPGSFHADPADQLIVATARQLGAALITSDERILAYPHVETVW